MNRKLLVLCLAGALVVHARARDLNGEFAQYSPEQREWLKKQIIPGTRNSCCNEADGTKAQEDDYKNGHYLISFEACYTPGSYLPAICSIQSAVEVPDEAVIKQPNMIGRPVVWYAWTSWDPNKSEGIVKIRCFIPYDGG